jgi:hypothetical protein
MTHHNPIFISLSATGTAAAHTLVVSSPNGISFQNASHLALPYMVGFFRKVSVRVVQSWVGSLGIYDGRSDIRVGFLPA